MRNIVVKDKIITVPSEKVTYNEKGFGDELFSLLKKNKNNVAQYILDTGETDSYHDFLQRSVRTALKLRDRNLTNDDVICICTNNHKNTLIPHLAAFFNNVPIAAIDINLSVEDNGYLLNIVKPKVIFVEQNSIKLVEDSLNKYNLKAEIIVFGSTETYISFSEFLKPDSRENNFKIINPTNLKDKIFIAFSSGTTGFPKAICHSHFSMLCFLASCKVYKNKVDSNLMSILCYSAPYWVSSLYMFMMSTQSGSPRIVANYDVNKVFETIEKYKVVILFVSISQATDICILGNINNNDVSSIKMVAAAGGSLPSMYRTKIKELFPFSIMTNAYVQTESGAITNFNLSLPEDLKQSLSKPTSCGKPIAGCSYKIVDIETGQLLGMNETGEMHFKADSLMLGYYNLDSSSCFDADGFIKTGDILYYDEDYCFYVVDRIKEMMKYRGYFVAPAELEDVLCAHPAVKEAVVVGIPHPEDIDHPMGVVIINENFQHVKEQDILDYVNNKVSDFKKLRGGLKIVTDLPRTATGKPKRKFIRDLAIQNKL